MSTITTVGRADWRRGDYAEFCGAEVRRCRVLRVSGTVLTVRDRHSWRVVEWMRARYEDARWFVADRWPRIVARAETPRL